MTRTFSRPAVANALITGFLSVTGFLFIYGNRANLPLGDEILWLPYLTGESPVTLRWLWSEHNDHRLFMPRVIYLALWHLHPLSFKTAMYFGFATLIASAVALQIVSARLRGRASWFDSVFPLLLLNAGHGENTLSGYNSVCNVLTCSATCGLLAAVMLSPCLKSPTARRAAIAFLVLLPLTTGTGALLAVPAAAFFIRAAIQAARLSEHRTSRESWAGALAVLLVIVASILTRRAPAPQRPDLAVALSNALKVSAMAFGSFLQEWKDYWPWYFGVLAILVIAAAFFTCRAARSATDVRSFLGLPWALVAGFTAGAAIIGYTRSYLGIDAGLQTRYSLLWGPLLFSLYFIFTIAAESRWAEGFQFLIFLACVTAMLPSIRVGQLWRNERNVYFDAISMGIRSGWTQADLVDATRARRFVYPNPALFDEYFRRLRAARLGPFEFSAGAPPVLVLDRAGLSLPGHIDTCESDGTAYRISGWAVCNGVPPASFGLVLDEGPPLLTSVHIPRPDVHAAVGVNGSGFQLFAPRRIEGHRPLVCGICPGETLCRNVPNEGVTCGSLQ